MNNPGTIDNVIKPDAAGGADQGFNAVATPVTPLWSRRGLVINPNPATPAGLSLMTADTDYAFPLPVFAREITVQGFAFYISSAASSGGRIRGTVYGVNEDMSLGTRVGYGTIFVTATSVGWTNIWQVGHPFILSPGVRYAIVMCGYNGGAGNYPGIKGWAITAMPTHFGTMDANSDPGFYQSVGVITWSRAYGSYPSTYNGTYLSRDIYTACLGLTF